MKGIASALIMGGLFGFGMESISRVIGIHAVDAICGILVIVALVAISIQRAME